jgi:hypothetical protein
VTSKDDTKTSLSKEDLELIIQALDNLMPTYLSGNAQKLAVEQRIMQIKDKLTHQNNPKMVSKDPDPTIDDIHDRTTTVKLQVSKLKLCDGSENLPLNNPTIDEEEKQ